MAKTYWISKNYARVIAQDPDQPPPRGYTPISRELFMHEASTSFDARDAKPVTPPASH